MSFVSPLFYVALAFAGTAFYVVPGRHRAAYLLVLSYAFYVYSSPLYLVLLIIASAASYALGLAIAASTSETVKLRLMGLGVAAIVAILIVFKAAGAWTGFLLPLGISYYSFKLISYLIEVYWDDEAVERDAVIFFLFPAFFPQIVSGPIQRPAPFFSQIRDVMRRPADDAQIEAGFAYIIGGLMLKLLVGDHLATFIAAVDSAHSDYSYPVVLITVATYTLQLYADFAGYTNIALGIGKIFGIEGPPNFNAPFVATNIQDMWRRWHMSLTTWVTDYLFTPLSMSLRDLGQAGLTICIVLNMVIIGLWHGLTLNFLVFGLLHAFFVTATVFASRWLRERAKMKAVLGGSAAGLAGIVLTFALMSFSQIFWHSPTWGQAISIFQQILGLAPSGVLGFADLGAGVSVPAVLGMAAAFYVGAGSPGANRIVARIADVMPRWLPYGVCLFLLSILSGDGGGNFVYGQF